MFFQIFAVIFPDSYNEHPENIMNPIKNALHHLTEKIPGVILFLIILIFLFSIPPLFQASTDDELESSINNPEIEKYYNLYKELFKNPEPVVLAFPIEELDQKALLKLFELNRKISSLNSVHSTFSVLNLLQDSKTSRDFNEYLVAYRIENLKSLLKNDSFFIKNLISENFKHLSMTIFVKNTSPDYQKVFISSIHSLLKDFFPDKKYSLYGYPVMKQRFIHFVEENNKIFLLVAIFLCGISTYLIFRSLPTLAVILFSVCLSPFVTFAIYILNGHKINIFMTPIIPLSMVISLNLAVYLFSFYNNEKEECASKKHQIVFNKLFSPCFLTSLTTFLGFISLGLNPSEKIQLFAWYASLSCVLSFFLGFLFLFSFLKLFPQSGKMVSGKNPLKILKWIKSLIFFHHKKILWLSLIISLFSIFCFTNLNKRNHLNDIFHSQDPVLKSYYYLSAWFDGPQTLEFLLEFPETFNSKYLVELDGFQTQISLFPEVSSTQSVCSLARMFSRHFTDSDSLPKSDVLLNSIINYFASLELTPYFIDNQRKHLVLRIQTPLADDFKIFQLAEKIQNLSLKNTPHSFKLVPTGKVFLNSAMQSEIYSHILYSFGFALVSIILVILFLFRTRHTIVIVFICNIIPVILAYGTAGLMKLPLNPSTIIVACVMIGLIVDDTIHLLYYFHTHLSRGVTRSILKTLNQVSSPIIISSIILGLGNMVFFFSSFKPFLYFGIIGFLTIFYALLCDLILVPCMIFSEKKNSFQSIELLDLTEE